MRSISKNPAKSGGLPESRTEPFLVLGGQVLRVACVAGLWLLSSAIMFSQNLTIKTIRMAWMNCMGLRGVVRLRRQCGARIPRDLPLYNQITNLGEGS